MRERHGTLRAKYNAHRISAKQRGIPFLLSFEKWLRIWKDSGHLHERGCRANCYVMARLGDRGAYAPDNVMIISCEANSVAGNVGRKRTAKTKAKLRAAAIRQWAKARAVLERRPIIKRKRRSGGHST
jgi:hypothetical protein